MKTVSIHSKSLLKMFWSKKVVTKEEIKNESRKSHLKKKQELFRNESLSRYTPLKEPDMLMNELKASLVLFFSLLDEQQRRIFAGLESLKHGYGGDRLIAGIFGVTEKTVARGRGELLDKKILFDSIRETGGGRKAAQKKTE
jgi:hypothetical protein